MATLTYENYVKDYQVIQVSHGHVLTFEAENACIISKCG